MSDCRLFHLNHQPIWHKINVASKKYKISYQHPLPAGLRFESSYFWYYHLTHLAVRQDMWCPFSLIPHFGTTISHILPWSNQCDAQSLFVTLLSTFVSVRKRRFDQDDTRFGLRVVCFFFFLYSCLSDDAELTSHVFVYINKESSFSILSDSSLALIVASIRRNDYNPFDVERYLSHEWKKNKTNFFRISS